MKALSFLITAFLIMPPVFADTAVKAQVLFVGESQSWVSGQKKRVESQLPVVGKVVIITRVDKGVEWILKPDKKMYQEKPIALPYIAPEKDEASGGSGDSSGSDSGSWASEENPCVPEIRKLSNTRVIAGYTATGFTAVCGKETAPGKIWMTPPVGPLAEVEKDDRAYNKAHAAALFSKYPPEEARELSRAVENFGELVKGFLAERMAKGTKFPKGVILAVEGSVANAPQQTLFEVKEIKPGPLDPAVFEIPAGYQKVPNLAKAVLESNLKDLRKFTEAIQNMKAFFSQAAPDGTGSESNPLVEAIARIKKAVKGTS